MKDSILMTALNQIERDLKKPGRHRAINFEPTTTGGQMECLEGFFKGYQILISDGDGSLPVRGQPWTMNLYKDPEDDSYLLTYEGSKFHPVKSLEMAPKLIIKALELEVKRHKKEIEKLYKLMRSLS